MNVNDAENSKELQQVKRLRFLDFLLGYRGWFTRQDLIEQFKIAPAGATKDIAEYKLLTKVEGSSCEGDISRNLEFDDSQKKYVTSDTYVPLYNLKFSSAVSLLRRSNVEGSLGAHKSIPIETPIKLSNPKVEILSNLSRCIGSNKVAEINFHSANRGKSTRKISPHSFFESEDKWYVRAYCHKDGEFKSFKLSRFESVISTSNKPPLESEPIKDDQWQRWVKLQIIPHDKLDSGDQSALRTEFNLELEECIEIKVRAAICGYWLSHWKVDCSPDGKTGEKDKHYQLRLANPETLYDVESAKLAPGFIEEEKFYKN